MADISKIDLNGTIYDIKDSTARTDLSNKADKADTVIDTTLSRGRRANTTIGTNSFAFGEYVTASGTDSHAEGYVTVASGNYSHAEGKGGEFTISANTYTSQAAGEADHVEGYQCRTESSSQQGKHAEGYQTKATKTAAHAEGYRTAATGDSSHAEGNNTTASGSYSHAEGAGTTASKSNAHAEGSGTLASGSNAHAEGGGTTASGDQAHAEGGSSTASGTNSHAEGSGTLASGGGSHAEGGSTIASGTNSHAEGVGRSGYAAVGQADHTEGIECWTEGVSYSGRHAEGYRTSATNNAAHSEGCYTIASGNYSHAEGNFSKASGPYSHAEGNGGTYTTNGTTYISAAAGVSDHVEGYQCLTDSSNLSKTPGNHAEGYQTQATGGASHSEGDKTLASGTFSHAEGDLTKATAYVAHAEGSNTIASGVESHAEGNGAIASGLASHAEGVYTEATGASSHVFGSYNILDNYSNWPEWTASTSYKVGDKVKITNGSTITGYICKTANSDSSFTNSKWINQNGKMNYVEIVGNGEDSSHRANARTLDWNGNEWIKGNLTGGGNIAMGSGVNVGNNAYGSIAVGGGANATGTYSQAFGSGTTASGSVSHAEGSGSTASGQYSHAEGSGSQATNYASHAEGGGTRATGSSSHSEGSGTVASGSQSHAEGGGTHATGSCAHAEGGGTYANGTSSHAEGSGTIANGAYSHVFGAQNIADSYDNWNEWAANTSYNVGDKVKITTTTNDNITTIEGYVCTTANSDSSFVSSNWIRMYGKMNYIEIVGNSLETTVSSNARALDWDGNEYLAGDLYIHANSNSTGGTKVATVFDIPDVSGKINTSEKGAANGVAELDANGRVPSTQLPSYVDDVLEYASTSAFPAEGETGKIYVALDTNKTYRWGGTEYVEISASLALGETSDTAYRGDRGKTAYDHASAKGSAYTSGLYKITTNSEGHVTGATAVAKSDITALGIPGQDTNTHRPVQLSGTQILGDNDTPLNLIPGNNVSFSYNGGNVTIVATDTTYENKAAASGGTDLSLVTTGEKFNWNNVIDDTAGDGDTDKTWSADNLVSIFESVDDEIDNTQDQMGIPVVGSYCEDGADVGEYVSLTNSTISGLDDGVYKVVNAIEPTGNVTAADLEPVEGGIANDLNQAIDGLSFKGETKDYAAIHTFTAGHEGIVNWLKANIDPVQAGSGDPSPSNVRAISGWTGANVSVYGKNMITVFESGSVNAIGECATASNRTRTGWIPIKPNTDYTINASSSTISPRVYIYEFAGYKTGDNYIAVDGWKSLPYTFTANASAHYMRVVFRGSNQEDITTASFTNVQIEEGSSDTSYTPIGNQYTVSFPTSAGTVYGGELTVNADGTGKLVVTKITYTPPASAWSWNASYNMPNFRTPADARKGQKIICNMYNGLSQKSADNLNNYPNSCATTEYGGYTNVNINGAFETLDDFKNYLATNEIVFVYELITPIEYDLSAPQIATLLGQNNLWCDTGDCSLQYSESVDQGETTTAVTTGEKANWNRTAERLNTLREQCVPIEVDCGTISSLPTTISDSRITATMVCKPHDYIASNESAITSRLTVTTADGSVTLSGTVSGSTTLKIWLYEPEV